ncbi:MAG: type III polyketide synthase [Spirochaetaceae bacterium]|jgi:predicted naringenin-chalcone synthase|nr:type III polyketide synthase [Spirochaetaceae bacterium]
MITQYNPIFLHHIETAVPPKSYTQDFVLNFFSNLGEIDDRLKSFMGKIYQNSAIEKRHTVIEDYDKEPKDYTFYPKNKNLIPSPSTKQRNDLFIVEANNLSLQVTEKLFQGPLKIKPQDVTHLITISCTGFSAPGFDMHLMKQLKLNPHTRRFHIGFMGCYAAFTGMDMAKNICEANPDARVLMVNVELCSLHFQPKNDLDTMVANALFADGVSAALISGKESDSEGSRIILETFQSQLLADSENDMAWYPGNTGFDMKLSAYVPKIIDRNIHDVLGNILKKSQLTLEDIDIWAIHPGGKAILEKVAVSLKLAPEELQVSYDTLRDYGNMSSSTIMFILKLILNDNREGRILGLGFGPGLTVETGCFQKIL